MKITEKRMFFRPGDLVAILLVIALAFGLLWAFLAAKEGDTVEIAVNGATVQTLSLFENTVYEVKTETGGLLVHVENGQVFVTDADCPDKVCEHTGRISAAGTSIVCAVARVSVRITGGGDSDVDHTAG